MPRGDRTGPMGCGPMTGRGMGYCAGYESPGHTRPSFGYRGFGGGRGHGFGRGFGRGWGRGCHHHPPAWGPGRFARDWEPGFQAPTREQELGYLQAEAEALKEQLDAIRARIADLEQSSEAS